MIALTIGLASSLLAALVALLIFAAFAKPRGLSSKELLRVYPDLLRLLASLARDRRVGRAVRWRLVVALVYNAQPFNLIPDFVPVIGFADNVAVTAWAVRSAIRRSGRAVVLGNWSGSTAGFAMICRLCRLRTPHEETETPDPVAPGPRADAPTGDHQSVRAEQSIGSRLAASCRPHEGL